jgi:zinc transport system ATP-binding protein
MSHAGGSLVDIDNLSVHRQHERVLDSVTLRVARGQLHAIVGPNGAGKSTLLTAILGQTPFAGRIALNWTGNGAIGYVPQSFAVDPTLPVTVEDFLALTRQRRPICLGLSSTTKATVSRLLARVNLAGLERRALAVLSGGELRRVLLAHALDPEPELLILDEPTSGLDDASGRWLEETLTTIAGQGRTTVLMVSHDLDQVRRLSHMVTVIDRRVVAEGIPTELLSEAGLRHFLPFGGRFDASRSLGTLPRPAASERGR